MTTAKKFQPRMNANKRELTGVQEIARERRRQRVKEAWTDDHDDDHEFGELALAGVAYAYLWALMEDGADFKTAKRLWPWDREWWNPSENGVKNLRRGGALLAAEIDRLKRKARRE